MKELRPVFENLNPTNNKCVSLTQAKICSLGFINFKKAKLTAPFQPFLYKKYTKCDTVKANKKFFRQKPEYIEFAKPFMPISNWAADITQ